MILRIVFHALPLLPLALGYRMIALATALLVGLAYIKVFKLEMLMKEAKRIDAEELTKTRDFWLALTFLKRDSPEK